MNKTISPRGYMLRQLIWIAEMIFILVVPIYLYGWLLGLLIHSGLSSLLHIAGLLCNASPKYVVMHKGKIVDDKDEVEKLSKED